MPNEDTARAAAARLKLSNADRERLIEALNTDSVLSPTLSPPEARRLLYRIGAERFRDRVLRCWAEAAEAPGWEALFSLAKDWRKPEFPIDGHDAIAAGAKEGPELGRVLASLERWWVEQDFLPGRDTLLAKLKERIGQRA
jgi:poly(A) polymerase